VAAGEDQLLPQPAAEQIQAMLDPRLEYRRGHGVVGGRAQHDDHVGLRGLVALADPVDPARHAAQPQHAQQNQPQQPAREPPGTRRRPLHAATHGSLSGSTLPPVSTIPTRRPANRAGCESTAASATAEDGSTSSLSSTSRRRIAAIVSASSTASTCAPCACRMRKFSSPTSVRRPSQMVSGTKPAQRSPCCSDCSVSAAPAGSASTSSTPGAMPARAIALPLASPPPPTGTTTTSRSGAACSSSSTAVPWPAITRGSA